MIFNPQNTVPRDGYFEFGGAVTAVAHASLTKSIFKEFWRGFTYRSSELSTVGSDEYIFMIGKAQKLPLDGHAYSINIEQTGICVCATNEKDLICGFMTLVDRFQAVDRDDRLVIRADCVQIKDSPLVQTRMVHFCVFPETELWELHRFLRLCAALRYSHVILEFWGMLRYDCMKELSWPFAFSKEQLRPILNEARELGLELVPMFNHWGHAAACRFAHGKHVVLNQNPTLQPYFSEDGWCWSIKNPKVRALLRKIRGELTELCGKGDYFHIGCDEAFQFELTKENMDTVCDYINEISAEMRAQNRRIIIWGDMFLYRHDHYRADNCYECNSPSPEAEAYMLGRLSRNIVIADWQYHTKYAPIETALVLQQAGFDCMLCPWDRGDEQTRACVSTIKEHHLMGLLHTTWNTLSRGITFVTLAALGCFESIDELGHRGCCNYTAALLRKVYFTDGDYERSGWTKHEIAEINT